MIAALGTVTVAALITMMTLGLRWERAADRVPHPRLAHSVMEAIELKATAARLFAAFIVSIGVCVVLLGCLWWAS